MADLAAIAPSCVAGTDFKEPLKQPTGVLTALAITTSYLYIILISWFYAHLS